MKTAEQIIQEYLDRGYSLESLRILAESRDQPLGGEMLAVIEAMRSPADGEVSETAEVHCETGTFSRIGDDMVFFVADDEPAAAGEDGVDFDLMAATAPDSALVSREESVAEILVGDSPEAEMISLKPAAKADAAADEALGETGIWSRLWSRVSQQAVQAELPADRSLSIKPVGMEYNTEMQPVREFLPDDADLPERSLFGEKMSSEAEPATEIVDMDSILGNAPTVFVDDEDDRGYHVSEFGALEMIQPLFQAGADSDFEVAVEEKEQEGIVLSTDPEPECGLEESPLFMNPVASGAIAVEQDSFAETVSSEISADYLPGSVAESYDSEESIVAEQEADAAEMGSENTAAVDEALVAEEAAESPEMAVERLIETAQASEPMEGLDAVEDEKAAASDDEDVPLMVEPCEEMLCDAAIGSDMLVEPETTPQPTGRGTAKSSRKERRRRERAEKKKVKRGKKSSGKQVRGNVAETDVRHEELFSEIRDNSSLQVVPLAEQDDVRFSCTENGASEDGAPEASGVAREPVVSMLTPDDVFESMADDDEPDVERYAVAEEEAVRLQMLALQFYECVTALAERGREELVKAFECAEAAARTETEHVPSECLGADHMMIIANGGVGQEEVDGLLSFDTDNEMTNEDRQAEFGGNNIIVFRDKFPAFAGEIEDDEEETAEEFFPAMLRMLSVGSEVAGDEWGSDVDSFEADERKEAESAAVLSGMVVEENAEDIEPAAAEPIHRSDILSADDKLSLIHALAGMADEDFYGDDEPVSGEAEHTIVSLEPVKESLETLLERETAARVEVETEYQIRLDAFAARVLEAQAAVAAGEARVEEKRAELDARTAVLSEMRSRLEAEEEKQRGLLAKLDQAKAETRARDDELTRFQGLQDEHTRLYKEFEDLRVAYNEIVTDVMPGLQDERDDLVLTIERQCEKERKLRTNLNSSRKRLAVGYSLAVAACLMLVLLPIANWFKSGDEGKQVAVDHQRMTQLKESLDTQISENIDAQSRIVELERKVTIARDELARLHSQNRELTSMAMAGQHAQGISVFRPQDSVSTGTPTRASTMALQAASQPGDPLRVNEVNDPVGSIEQLAEANRQRNRGDRQPSAEMAGVRPQGNIPVSAVASTTSRTARPASVQQPRNAGGLRPQTASRDAGPAGQERAAVVTAKVRKGEGVAQVVYRVLGSRDPDIIAWVIEENKIRSDRRGNPIIQPNQELRLPQEGRIGQAASSVRPRSR